MTNWVRSKKKVLIKKNKFFEKRMILFKSIILFLDIKDII
jgi:hypothetical protein